MGWSRTVLAVGASTLGAIALLFATSFATAVWAQEAGEEEAAEETAAATRPVLGSGNEVEQFELMLEQVEAIEIYNRQMQSLIESQVTELASMEEQIARVDIVERSIPGLMEKMIEALDQFVSLDVPFQIDERKERVQKLREMMNSADVKTPEKFRRIMEAYQIENEYGRSIEAYRSTLKKDGSELVVDFLRFGRIALVYQSLDEAQAGVWNTQTRSWEELDSSYKSAIRQGLRIARKQAAPDLIRLPLPAAGGAS